jgi:hypothetical protein
MTNQPLNGSAPTDPLQQANLRFARAFMMAKAPDGKLNFNPMQLLIEVELLKLNLSVLLDQAGQSGMDTVAFNASITAQLNAQAAAMEESVPRIAVPGRVR